MLEHFGWDFTTIGQFISLILSALILVTSIIAGSLYLKAYYQMKKTAIILSVSLMLYAIALKFMVTSMGYFFIFTQYQDYDPYFFNALNGFPNVILLLAVMNFVHQSIKTPEKAKDCLKQINDTDIRKI
jgi:hypothetical protein